MRRYAGDGHDAPEEAWYELSHERIDRSHRDIVAIGRDAALCAHLASRVPAFVTAPTFVFGRDGAALPSRSEALRERIAVARGLV